MDLVIRELSPALVDDFLGFFDRDAFPDNPEWSACYCRFWQHGGTREDWDRATAGENRAAMAERIRGGEAQGLLAYRDGKPVGWCQASRPRHLTSLGCWLRASPGEDTGCITCFVVTPSSRRCGVARRLLEAALDFFRRSGLAQAEAYPSQGADSDASNYPGPLDLYLQAGFRIIGPVATIPPMRPDRLLVRRAL